VGKSRRDGYERERRAPRLAARTGRNGARSRRHSRHAAGLQPVERHHSATREFGRHLSRRDARLYRGHQRHLRSQLPAGAGAAARGRRGGARSPQLHAIRRRPAKLRRAPAPLPPAHRARLGARLGRVRERRERKNAPGLSLQPQQPHRFGAFARSHAAHCRALRSCGRVPAGRRSLSRRRDPLPAHAQLLGHERARHRHQRVVESLRHPGRPHRLDRRAAGRGGAVLEPARLHHHRAEQDLRCGGARGRPAGQPRETLRPHAGPSCSTTCR
jgi:hypothetical protein